MYLLLPRPVGLVIDRHSCYGYGRRNDGLQGLCSGRWLRSVSCCGESFLRGGGRWQVRVSASHEQIFTVMDDGEAEVHYEPVAWTRGRRTYERIPDSIDSDNVLRSPYSSPSAAPLSSLLPALSHDSNSNRHSGYSVRGKARGEKERASLAVRLSSTASRSKASWSHGRPYISECVPMLHLPVLASNTHFVVDGLVSVGDAWLWVWGRGGGIVKWRGEVCTLSSHAALQLVLVQVG